MISKSFTLAGLKKLVKYIVAGAASLGRVFTTNRTKKQVDCYNPVLDRHARLGRLIIIDDEIKGSIKQIAKKNNIILPPKNSKKGLSRGAKNVSDIDWPRAYNKVFDEISKNRKIPKPKKLLTCIHEIRRKRNKWAHISVPHRNNSSHFPSERDLKRVEGLYMEFKKFVRKNRL